jgi:hypothetical protein
MSSTNNEGILSRILKEYIANYDQDTFSTLINDIALKMGPEHLIRHILSQHNSSCDAYIKHTLIQSLQNNLENYDEDLYEDLVDDATKALLSSKINLSSYVDNLINTQNNNKHTFVAWAVGDTFYKCSNNQQSLLTWIEKYMQCKYNELTTLDKLALINDGKTTYINDIIHMERAKSIDT